MDEEKEAEKIHQVEERMALLYQEVSLLLSVEMMIVSTRRIKSTPNNGPVQLSHSCLHTTYVTTSQLINLILNFTMRFSTTISIRT
jgi:hypothetical protein